MCYFEPHIKQYKPLFYIHNTAVSIIYECNRYWFYTKTPQVKYPMYYSYKAYEYPQKYSFTVTRFMATAIAPQHAKELLGSEMQLSLLNLKYVKLHFLLCVLIQKYKQKYISSILYFFLSYFGSKRSKCLSQ